jgi:hypothetical protein
MKNKIILIVGDMTFEVDYSRKDVFVCSLEVKD